MGSKAFAVARGPNRQVVWHGFGFVSQIVSDGTDNHLVLVDLKPVGIDGARVQNVLDEVRHLRDLSV
jgi:glycine/serine hydroxymethyltransferase